MSTAYLWHWHARLLFNPFVHYLKVKLDQPSYLHIWYPPLTDHRIEGVGGKVQIDGCLTNGNQAWDRGWAMHDSLQMC
jgi:hypothetical protein